jgi:DNA-binding NarL/FixJ family response regulator
MPDLRLLVFDEQPLMIAAIRVALGSERGLEIVGEATLGSQVLSLVANTSPDVVLLGLPTTAALVFLQRIRERHSHVKVVMFSSVSDPAVISTALDNGASAYILKTIDPADLGPVLRQAAYGAVFSVGTLGALPTESTANEAGLSEREVEILQGVSQGLSNRAIAKELWLSDQTVKFHLHNVYRKLGVKNRTEAAKYAFEHGLAGSAA